MVAFHCELAWLGAGAEIPEPNVLVEVEGEKIRAVTPSVPAPESAIRLRGVTLPGLANAHSHAFHRALRCRTQSGAGNFWTWRDAMYRLAAALNPDSYYRLARATFAEMVLAGVSSVGEFHYLHHTENGTPYADPNAMGHAIVAAAADAGLRLTLLDTCYLGSGVDPEHGLLPAQGTQRRFSDGTVEAWAMRVEALTNLVAPNVHIGAAIHSVRAVDAESVQFIAEWARQNARVVHAHVSEQPAENEQCQRAFGRSPLELLAERGALTSAFTAVHATHVGPREITLISNAEGGVCLCPTTERDLADGIGPTALLRDASVPMSLGSDSHAVIDLFEEARALELDQRLASGTRGTHGIRELLRAVTANGHRSLGWPEAGRIAAGAPCDLVSVRLGSVRTAGSDPEHALAAVVYAATASEVTDVVISGEHVVEGGRHRSIDVARELDSAIREVWALAI